MRGLPKLKVNFEYEKKQEDKAVKIPKVHVYNLSKVRKIVVGLLIVLMLYFAYVLVLANGVAIKNRELRHNINNLTTRLDKASAG
ncbi:MAG: conjugal transfer protein, partial [Aerococcus urinaeequi]